MKLYHTTTPKKAKLYKETGAILKPVRGFSTLTAAMAWSISINGTRTVFYEIDTGKFTNDSQVHKFPDHHNQFGEAWWIDEAVPYEVLNAYSVQNDAVFGIKH